METQANDATVNAGDDILGQGDWQFQIVKGWGVQDAAKVPIKNMHEMAQAKDGLLYIIGDHTANNVLVYEPDGKLVRTFGDDYNGGHGLPLVEENGEEFLWLANANPDRPFARKVTLDGKKVMELGRPDCKEYEGEARFIPTEVDVNPANGDIYVADGYGSSLLAHYNANGELIGCYGAGDDFQCMHGVRVDRRDPDNPHLWVTSRSNNQIRRMTFDGKIIETLHFPGGWPCRATFVGDHVVFPLIWANSTGQHRNDTGFVMILGPDNKPVSLVGGLPPGQAPDSYYRRDPKLKLPFINPHDAFIDSAGDLYTPQWASRNTYPLKFKRVRA